MSYSKFATKVKRYYDAGTWTARMVRDALDKGRITDLECACILRDGVLEALGSSPTKAELLDAAEMLGLSVPEGATKAEIEELIAESCA